MKAQRRHDLQTNALSRMMAAFPDFFNKHGNKLLFGLVVIAALFFAWRWRQNSAAKEQVDLRAYVDQARNIVRTLRLETDQWPNPRAAKDEIESLLRPAMERLTDPTDQAQAYLVWADYNLALAQYPISTEAATRPTLRPEKQPEEYLAEAAKTYQTALDRFAKEKDMAIVRRQAHLGLGAVAEDRAFFAQQAMNEARAKQDDAQVKQSEAEARQFLAEARQQYQAVADDAELPELLKKETTDLIAKISGLESAVVIGPAVIRPKNEPKSEPKALPVEPVSRPASGPASGAQPVVRPSSGPVAPPPATTRGH